MIYLLCFLAGIALVAVPLAVLLWRGILILDPWL